MIRLDKKTKQDFLSRELAGRLAEVGIDMTIDAKYYIGKDITATDFIVMKDELEFRDLMDVVPTYTLAELLYKLNEYPYIEEGKLSASLSFCKDAPFYIWYYPFKDENGTRVKGKTVEMISEYPIESAARLLIYCAKNEIPYVRDISTKE